MAIRIFWYSGTGNSLAVARNLGNALGGAELVPMRGNSEPPSADTGDTIGIVFPVHMWGPPPGVTRFIEEHLPADDLPGRLWDQTHHAQGRDAFPAATLSDNTQGLARLDAPAYAIDRPDQTVGCVKLCR